MKPLNPSFQKKQRLAGADAWRPFSPGWCYQLGLKVLLPEHCAAATWRPFSPGWKVLLPGRPTAATWSTFGPGS